jgi:hypothetical protein
MGLSAGISFDYLKEVPFENTLICLILIISLRYTYN